MKKLSRISLFLSVMAAATLLIGIFMQAAIVWEPAAIATVACMAFGLGAVPSLKGFRYTAWIITAVVAGMVFPEAFTKWGDFDLRNKWLILIIVQLVMFGMGIQMSIRDFTGLATTGKGVVIGLFCHSQSCRSLDFC